MTTRPGAICRQIRLRTLFALLLAACGLVAETAAATATFPNVLQTYYGLPSVVDPPEGCTLCHVNGDVGGDPLTHFGNLLHTQFGLVENDEASLKAALVQLPTQDPLLVADLMAGMDPNGDVGKDMSTFADGGLTGVAAAAGPMDPIPSYGCGVGRVGGRDGSGALALAEASLMGAGILVRRRLSKRLQRSPNQL